MSIADDIFNDGKIEGIAKGELEMATRLLNRKFGQLSPEYIATLKQLSAEDLLQIPDRIFDATSIYDVLPSKNH